MCEVILLVMHLESMCGILQIIRFKSSACALCCPALRSFCIDSASCVTFYCMRVKIASLH